MAGGGRWVLRKPGGRGAQRRRRRRVGRVGDPSSIYSFPATSLLLKHLPSSALSVSLLQQHPITTTVPIHFPQQFASQVQIYSTSTSPRHLNTSISVRRHLSRPSLPMSIENLKSYGQFSESTTQFLCIRRWPSPRCSASDCAANVKLRRTRHCPLVLSALSTVQSPQPWDSP